MATRIKLRRDTNADWTANNPTLSEGEVGIVTDAASDDVKIKIGDGTTAWNSLSYFDPGNSGAVWGSITGTLSNQVDLQNALDAKLNLSGGAMSGDLNMGTNDITDVGSIELENDGTIVNEAGSASLQLTAAGAAVVNTASNFSVTASGNLILNGASAFISTTNDCSIASSDSVSILATTDLTNEGSNIYSLVDGGYTKGWQELTQTYSALGFGANQFYADGSGMQIQVDTGSTVIVNNDSDIDITATSGNVDITSSGAISFIQGTDTYILPSKSGVGGTVAMINNETFTGDTTFSDLTASRATYLDASKVLKTSVVTQAELELLSGYTEHEFIQLKKVVITISEAEMLALNGTPLDAIAAVSGKVVSLIDVVGRYNYNTAAYSGNAITLKYDGGADIASFNASFTTATASEREKATINGSIKVLENTKVQIYVPGANPTTGDGDYEIAIIYREEDFV